jgi:hypothetical protein
LESEHERGAQMMLDNKVGVPQGNGEPLRSIKHLLKLVNIISDVLGGQATIHNTGASGSISKIVMDKLIKKLL